MITLPLLEETSAHCLLVLWNVTTHCLLIWWVHFVIVLWSLPPTLDPAEAHISPPSAYPPCVRPLSPCEWFEHVLYTVTMKVMESRGNRTCLTPNWLLLQRVCHLSHPEMAFWKVFPVSYIYVFRFLNLIVWDEDVLYIKYIRTSQSKKDGSTGIHVPFTVLYVQKGLNPAVDIIYI